MSKKSAVFIFVISVAIIVLAVFLASCDSSCIMSSGHAHDDAVCDTTLVYGFDWHHAHGDSVCATVLIECVTTQTDTLTFTVIDTVFVESPPDTIVVAPDYACVADCIEINGLGHWRECLSACLPAQ